MCSIMKISIKTKNLDLTPALTEYVEEKLGTLQKFLDSVEGGAAEVIARVEIARTTNHHAKGEVYRVVVNLDMNKNLVRAEEEGFDVRAIVDVIRDTLQNEIVKFKEKRRPQDSGGESEIRGTMRGK